MVEAIGCRVAATAEQQEHWQLSFRSNISNSKQAAASGCAFIAAATTADVGKERDGKNWRAGKLARYWGKLQFFRNLDCPPARPVVGVCLVVVAAVSCSMVF